MGKPGVTRSVRQREKRKWYIDTDTGEIKPEPTPGRELEIWDRPAEAAPLAVQAPDYVID